LDFIRGNCCQGLYTGDKKHWERDQASASGDRIEKAGHECNEREYQNKRQIEFDHRFSQ